MAKTKTQPELRFAGFTEDWVEKKAKELCSISTGKSNTQDNIKDGIYPFYVRSPIIERSNKFLFDEEAVLTVGDGVGTGKVHHYVNGKYDLHQRVYRMFDFKEITGKYFYLFFSNNFHARVTAMTAKSSVDSVRLDMIAEMNIKYPEISEQLLIGNFFENIDNLITEHQQKHSKLKALKKAMLGKMFPKQGQLVPEIRFKGFNDEWVEKSLGKVCEIQKGVQINIVKLAQVGKYPVINGGITPSGYTDNWNSLENTITISEGGNSCGFVNFLETKFWSGGHCYTLYKLSDKVYAQFLFQELKSKQPEIMELRVGSGLPNIQKGTINNFIVYLPTPTEQKLIGDYFKTLDILIYNHKTEIEKIQNIKKAFLAKMFI